VLQGTTLIYKPTQTLTRAAFSDSQGPVGQIVRVLLSPEQFQLFESVHSD